MKYQLLVAFALLFILLVASCMWPFSKKGSEPLSVLPPGVSQPPVVTSPPSPPVQAAQKWLVYGIPLLILAAIGLGVMAVYLRNSLALYGSGGCVLGAICDIVLLTFWKPIAWIGFIIVCLALAAVVVLVGIKLKTVILSLTTGSENALTILEGVSSPAVNVVKESLRIAQEKAGTRDAVNAIRKSAS